ncbi:hypothetical protein CR983_00900 [Candidatus Saccharibacteria bacterium]|nr:MAG: hypothetical protein CR983_00900 [Candidatus Saccharibacteria bacterium]
MKAHTITINGRTYDRHTGMPLHDVQVPASSAQPRRHAQTLHRQAQHTKTLNRRYVKQPALAQPRAQAAPQPVPRKKPVTHTISRHAKPAIRPTAKRIIDIPPTVHPMVQRVQAARQPQPNTVVRADAPAAVLKQQAINEALERAPAHNAPKPPRHRDQQKEPAVFARLWQNRASLAAIGVSAMLLVGYVTYLNMPNLSIRVAAAQAGIEASLPGYKPSGYSLSGPIAYENGEVSIKYAANGGPRTFTLTQARSGWDSSAVLDNYVMPRAAENYTITRDSGLTIYSWDDQAAWVSGGILYTIDGDAPLAVDQIRRMAVSM